MESPIVCHAHRGRLTFAAVRYLSWPIFGRNSEPNLGDAASRFQFPLGGLSRENELLDRHHGRRRLAVSGIVRRPCQARAGRPVEQRRLTGATGSRPARSTCVDHHSDGRVCVIATVASRFGAPALRELAGRAPIARGQAQEKSRRRFPCASQSRFWETGKGRHFNKPSILVARPEGFEPPTPRFVVWCSIQLSYGRLLDGGKGSPRGRGAL